MKEALLQYDGKAFRPYTETDVDQCAEFKRNQVVRARLSGIQKERSVPQLRRYWALCRLVADNTEDPHWNTAEKVDHQIRHALQFIDMDKTIVTPKGDIVFCFRSIAFANLGHIEACNYFNRADEIIARRLGCDVDDLDINLARAS